MLEILVVGSLNTDLVVRTPRFPQPGETISGEDLRIFPGGKGANQAVAAARQGARVAMVGRVGRDSFGAFLVESLRSDQIDTSHVAIDTAATGTAIIMVDTNGQNSIVLSAGANGHVSRQDVDALHTDAKLLLLQLEIPLETVMYAAQWGKQNGMIVILNPAPAQPLPDQLLASTDFVLPNETELSLLTGTIVNDNHSAQAAARILRQRGAKNVIVTLGEKGALVVAGSRVQHIDSFRVKVVDTTAAGDAFIGGFAARVVESGSLLPEKLDEAVRYANACGALATTRLGAQPSLPVRAEVEKLAK